MPARTLKFIRRCKIVLNSNPAAQTLILPVHIVLASFEEKKERIVQYHLHSPWTSTITACTALYFLLIRLHIDGYYVFIFTVLLRNWGEQPWLRP